MSTLGAGRVIASRGPTLNDAAAVWLDGLRAGHIRNRSGDPYKPSAIRGYEHTLRRRVLPVLGHYRLAQIRPQDVQKLIDGLVRADVAPATIDAALTPLRALYRRAVARGEVPNNPTLRIEKHANIAITLDLYGHLMPGSEAEAATLLYAYLAREVGGSTSPATSPDLVGKEA